MLRRRFTFPRMRTRVRQHVRTCDTCQHSRGDRHLPKGLMEKISLPCQKWQSLAMDWTGGLPRISSRGHVYDQVLVVMDRATRMVHLIPTWKDADAVDTAHQFLDNIIRLRGIPRSIISDRDWRLTSDFWRHLCDILNIRLRPSSSYHPQTNGQTERMNKTM